MKGTDILLARQPIYDRQKELFAYELLFRDSQKNTATVTSDSSATSDVLLSLFTDSDLKNVTGDLPAFINFSEDLLLAPPLFNPKNMVIEILEGVDITPKIVAKAAQLKQNGYTIALDDFVPHPKYEAILPYVDIVKVELPAIDYEALPSLVDNLRKHPCKLLAEKVETYDQYYLCHQLGFDLFQGYFLAKPEVLTGKKIGANQLAVLELISELQSPEVDIAQLTQVISRDPNLSYKLLKLINSAAFRRPKEIDSIHGAVVMLSIEKVKSWASLLALSNLVNKPDALQYIAFVRALTCEMIAARITTANKNSLYTIGLLSCLDAFFDQPLDAILKDIPIEDAMKEAILAYRGLPGLILQTTINFEHTRLEEIDWEQLSKYDLSPSDINDIYYEASSLALNA